MPYDKDKRYPHVCIRCSKEWFTTRRNLPSGLCYACAHAGKLTLHERFWQYVQKTETCWLWMGARAESGYGTFWVNPDHVRAHRVSYMMHYGPIPDGLYVLHTCDNPPCVNPVHLWLGTHSDNALDMVKKGRVWQHLRPENIARGDRNGARLHPERMPRGARHGSQTKPGRLPRGIQHHKAKLTEEQVREIRQLYRVAEGKRGIKTQLGARFGVGYRVISRIVLGKAWAHVQDEPAEIIHPPTAPRVA